MRAVKFGLMAPERLKDSAREGFGRTAIAYVVLLVALVLTVLAFYYVGRNVEAREHERFEEITGSAERAVDRRMQTGAMYFAPCQHAQASQALCKRHQAKPIT